jgi:hypothetical protein
MFVAAFVAVTVFAATALVFRAKPAADALAYTECPFFDDPLIVTSPTVDSADRIPVRVHEGIHADQCRSLGPVRYRWKNLTSGGRLSLEAPAYCAAAVSRLTRGDPQARVRERLLDDARAAFAGALDSAAVDAALTHACPSIASR